MTIREKELEELRESDARSRVVMETLADAVVTIDASSAILYVNAAASKVFGHEVGEMLGRHLTMLMPDYLRHVHEAGLARYVETGRRHISWEGVELPGLHKSGQEIALEVSFGEFVDEAGRQFFTGVARDITERKRAARHLAIQYELTRVLAEAPTTREAAVGILRTVCENLNWQTGTLWSVDREAEVLRRAETWHAPGVDKEAAAQLSAGRSFGAGEGFPGLVWETAAPQWVADIAASKFMRAPDAERAGLHAAFAFPVVARGRTVGVIEFFSSEAREPDAALLATMANVGVQVGQVIERGRIEEERASLREQVIRIQEAQLEELSTPLIPITDELLVMPLVGAIDARRAQRMIDTLLRGVAERRVAFAIIDITGVSVVDSHVADTLIRAAQSARLLGTEVVLTGIRAGVARTLIGLGIELHGVTTRKSLQSGIAYALERLRRQT